MSRINPINQLAQLFDRPKHSDKGMKKSTSEFEVLLNKEIRELKRKGGNK